MIQKVIATRCLACSRRLRAPDKETLRQRMLRHGRNCAALSRERNAARVAALRTYSETAGE